MPSRLCSNPAFQLSRNAEMRSFPHCWHSCLSCVFRQVRYADAMSETQPEEVTVEDYDDLPPDEGRYEIVRVESQGQWVVVVVRERALPTVRAQ